MGWMCCVTAKMHLDSDLTKMILKRSRQQRKFGADKAVLVVVKNKKRIMYCKNYRVREGLKHTQGLYIKSILIICKIFYMMINCLL